MDMVKNMFTFKKCYSLYLKTIEFRNISLWYQLQKKLIEKMVWMDKKIKILYESTSLSFDSN